MTRKMFVYSCGPIDYWEGWHTEAGYRKAVESVMGSADDFQEMDDQIRKGKALATLLGWEGDGEVLVSVLPGTGVESHPLYAWKQSNNGTTFVASPFPLPWLEQGNNWRSE